MQIQNLSSGPTDKVDLCFLVINLFYSGGRIASRGKEVHTIHYSYRNLTTCDFPGGLDPWSPSESAHIGTMSHENIVFHCEFGKSGNMCKNNDPTILSHCMNTCPFPC